MERDRQQRHQKRALRRSIKQSILGLDPDVRAAAEAQLIAQFPALPGYAAAQTVLLYVSAFAEEINTHSFFLHALAAGKRVLCPRVQRQDNRMRLFQITSPTANLEPGILGIPEPREDCALVAAAEVDWALIPGLAFDCRCYRLGRGGGHYDRLLPRMRPDASCWALGFDCQLAGELPIEPHDVPIDGVATPGRLIHRQ
ncbi:MAG: 5-formyltetrahydrofolate cyclo-ligase [Isosphaeraceae bacterium]